MRRRPFNIYALHVLFYLSKILLLSSESCKLILSFSLFATLALRFKKSEVRGIFKAYAWRWTVATYAHCTLLRIHRKKEQKKNLLTIALKAGHNVVIDSTSTSSSRVEPSKPSWCNVFLYFDYYLLRYTSLTLMISFLFLFVHRQTRRRLLIWGSASRTLHIVTTFVSRGD